MKTAANTWIYTDVIVESSKEANTKFLALAILEDAVNVSPAFLRSPWLRVDTLEGVVGGA